MQPVVSLEQRKKINVKYYQISDKGLKRATNQDACNIVKSKDNHLLLFVSDGIGGGNAGDVCSLTVSKYLTKLFKNQEFEYGFNYFQYLRRIIQACNLDVLMVSKSNPAYRGMGATLTGALVSEDKTFIFNVGDSRCYTIKDGQMKCVTHDHTLLASLMENGLIEKESITNNNKRNILINALGIESELRIDIDAIDNDYDYLLVCSDGLYGYLEEDEILETILKEDTIENKCQNLIDLANGVGGFDNCTVVLLDRGNE